MLLTEEELAVEVGQVDSVQIHDMYFAKAAEDQVLEQFAADAAGADHEYSSL